MSERTPERRELMKQMAVLGTASAAGIATIGATSNAFAQTDVREFGGDFSILIAASDAPQGVKNIANVVCTGANDQIEINQAIAKLLPSRNSGLGGVVHLSQGNFDITDQILMRTRTSLIGSGRATILKARSSWNSRNNPGLIGGVIEPDGNDIDKCHVASLAIDGNNREVHGIFFNITQPNFDDGSPDAANSFTDLYIWRTGGDGIHLTGTRMRATQLSRIRVWNPGGYGYFLNNPDSFYSHLETGSSGKSGFFIGRPNNRLTNCKAWFSAGHGFQIDSQRNQLSACESQDNVKHGYDIRAGQVSLTSCHADSNSWNRDNPQSNYSGFFIHQFYGYVQLISCQAYDKNENNRGEWQKYGFELEGSNSYCQIIGSGRGNASGKLSNPSPGVDSKVEVIGA